MAMWKWWCVLGVANFFPAFGGWRLCCDKENSAGAGDHPNPTSYGVGILLAAGAAVSPPGSYLSLQNSAPKLSKTSAWLEFCWELMDFDAAVPSIGSENTVSTTSSLPGTLGYCDSATTG